MTIAQALRAHVLQQPAVAALIGTRFYPGYAAPEAELPYVIYEQQGRQQAGTLGAPADLRELQVELNVWANDYDEAHALSEALIACLAGFRGLLGTVPVHLLDLDDEQDRSEPGLGLFNVAVSFRVHHHPAA